VTAPHFFIVSLRGADPVSRDLRRKHKRIQKAYRDLEAKLGRAVRDEEMAGALGMGLAQWYRALNAMQAAGPDFAERVLTAAPAFTQHSVDPALLADDSSTTGPSPFDFCFRREQRDILCRAVSCNLNDRLAVFEPSFGRALLPSPSVAPSATGFWF